MLRTKLESESGTEIADCGFLIIYEKPADSGSRIRIAIPDNYHFKNENNPQRGHQPTPK